MSNETDKTDSNRDHRNRYIIWFILAIALLLRWGHLIIISGTDLVRIPIIDSAFYHDWAARIAGGELLGSQVFFMSPLYPYLLGLLYLITGAVPWATLLFQGITGTATVWLVYRIGNRISGHRSGLIAAAIAAVYGPFIFYDATLLTATLILFLSALIINFTLDVIENGSNLNLWKLGLAIGLSALARPLVMIFLPFLFYLLFTQDRSNWLKRAATVFAAVLVLLVPVGIRNLVIGGEFTLTTSSAGMNFYVGNNPEATGLYWEAPFLSSVEPWFENEDYRRVASEAVERNLTTREAGGYWRNKSLDWMINNPGDYLLLLSRKIFYFWNRAEFANNVSIYMGKEASPLLRYNPFGFWLTAPIGLAGLVLLWKKAGWKRARTPWLWLIAYFSGMMIFFVSSEYRLPILLSLIVGAGFFVDELIKRVRNRKIEPVLSAVVLGLVFMPFINLRTDFIKRGENARMDYFNYGSILLKNNKYEASIERFQKSLEIDPYFAEGLLKLADAYYRSGQTDKALDIGKRAGLENPETVLSIIKGQAIHEAYALLEEGKLKDAMSEFAAAGLDSSAAVAETTRVSRLKRAQISYSEGRHDEAMNLFQLVRADDKDKDPSVFYNIAFMLWQSGEIDSAEFYATEAIEVDSMNIPTAYLLARIYNATDRREQAENLIRRVNPDTKTLAGMLNDVRCEMDSLEALGDPKGALKAYSRYGRLGNEIEPPDKLRIGRLQYKIGNNDIALRLLSESEILEPHLSENYYYQALTLIAMGRNSEGVETLQRSIVTDPANFHPRIALARQYIFAGRNNKAWKELEAVEHLTMDDPALEAEYTALRDSLKSLP